MLLLLCMTAVVKTWRREVTEGYTKLAAIYFVRSAARGGTQILILGKLREGTSGTALVGMAYIKDVPDTWCVEP